MAKASARFTPTPLTTRIPPARVKVRLHSTIDPIFAAIDKHRKLLKEWERVFAAIDRAENTVKKPHPASIASLYRRLRHALRAEAKAGMRMARMKPKTLAGASAMVAYARDDIAVGLGPKWPLVALTTVATALAAMDTT